MIKIICLLLISFYQRVLSPVKGFNCAHHRLHHGDTCSNAIKKIIIDSPLRDILCLSRARFKECKRASITLAQQNASSIQTADLPCDIGCIGDISCFGDAPGSDCGKSNDACSLPCDLCFEFPNLKRRTQIILVSIALIPCLAMAYFYGSQISKIEITQLQNSQRSDSLIDKLVTRDSPSLRAAVIVGSQTHYSDIVDSAGMENGAAVVLHFSTSVSISEVGRLELQDARFSAVQDLIVVGQKIDVVDQPGASGNGKRYHYEFKSRWGF